MKKSTVQLNSDRQHDEVENGDVVTLLALNAKDLYNEVVKQCPGIAILA